MSLFDQVEKEIAKITNECFKQIEEAKDMVLELDPDDNDFSYKVQEIEERLRDAQATLGDLD
ncbi:Uncharacterised protein [Phocoenobacter uteri]|uniref:Uncharacterized protein n=1 Tax=Phocoenobacter uteri TaxID=146806 RepID=A0A379C9K3_9PAST|nr:hypothetical protein [Phocoenobacter uteri]MDG6880981.1 hypothetical protein [Phocoenobacter uteri]SUB59000.1 Uncharacterised protein [Phocoenobacter uteri]SUB76462.1 Uncharacterised protein [Phocoenobacter uteri]